MNGKDLKKALKNIDFLLTHNKNLTKKQYFSIIEISEFFEEIKREADERAIKYEGCNR